MKIFNPNMARFLVQSKLDALSRPADDLQGSLKLQKLKKACRDFEAIFISYMLKTMNRTTENSDLFGDGLGGDIYKEIFNEKIGEYLSETGQFKIGDMIYQKYAGKVHTSDEKAGPEAVYPVKSEKVDKPATADIKLPAPSPEPDRTVVELPPPVLKKPPESASKSVGKRDFLSEYEDAIFEAAREYNVQPALIKAVIKHESGGNPEAVSSRGAKGLMQLIDSTAVMLGVNDPFNPVQNIMGGVRYLSMLIKRFNGDLRKALASYNAGPANVEKYNGVPPFTETIEYVENIMASLSSE